ncbi:MAG TPA: (2Fe-2S)-binding protein [Candidatus Acidoferrales bacterium]|nr:(2Fe-2S)-binding protein [Candidatus Acidoferrales bacterium]
MSKRDHPDHSTDSGSARDGHSQKKGKPSSGLSRRQFIKGTGLAVSASVLVSEGLLKAAGAQEASGVAGPGAVPIRLRVNGQVRELRIEPRVMLLDALRNHLDITGSKKVCDRASCGACTVIVDGRPVYSCTMLAIDAQGRSIETIESLASGDDLHPMSQSFVDNDAQQCGFCTSGFVMACKAYLDKHPHPTYDEVKKALNGNLCRCGTYMGIRNAVLEAATKTSTKGAQA